MRKCTFENCTQPYVAGGFCNRHYLRWKKHGSPATRLSAELAIPEKHGMTDSSEYRVWASMLSRCANPNLQSYPKYGGRGVKVCESWRIFTNFLADMGGRPSEQHTLDRIDNSGDYEPGNCRWATKTQQTINQRLSARNSSGYRGVTWDAARNKWKVCVQVNHQNFNVGRFDDLRTAAWMRDQWAISLHDEDVHLNFDYQ